MSFMSRKRWRSSVEFRYEVRIEVTSLKRFGVDQQAAAPDPVGQLKQSSEHVPEKGRP
jgi:hypothetical protein